MKDVGVIRTVARNGGEYSVQNVKRYGVWGGVRSDSGASSSASGGHLANTDKRYCANLGHASDIETGLIYMRARYYEPTTGRFLSEDPARDGRNWFVYGDNSPTLHADPTGLASTTLAETFESAAIAEAAASGSGNAVAALILGRASHIVVMLQTRYSMMAAAIGYGLDKAGNAGIQFVDKLGSSHLFRFEKVGQDWLIKHTSDGKNFGIDHNLTSKNAADLIEALKGILD